MSLEIQRRILLSGEIIIPFHWFLPLGMKLRLYGIVHTLICIHFYITTKIQIKLFTAKIPDNFQGEVKRSIDLAESPLLLLG